MTTGFRIIFFSLAAVLVGLTPTVTRAGSIFDDDYVPPAPVHPAAVSPATAPVAPPEAVPAPPPVVVIPSAGPAEQPGPATAPAPEAPLVPNENAAAPAVVARLPIPAPAEQAKSRKLFKEAFADELKDSSQTGRRALAGKLLSESDKIVGNPCDRFVLLIGACNAAAEACDLRLASSAASATASLYDVDGPHLSADVVLKTPLKASTSTQAADAVEGGLEMESALEQVDDYTTANRLLTVLQPLASKAQSPTLHARVAARMKEVTEERTAFERVQAARQILAAKPDDPEANLNVGKYLWLEKNDIAGAMPFFSKGRDVDLKALATGDLAATADGDAITRGDAWWQYSVKQSGLARIDAERRAASFYRKAEATLAGLQKIKTEKRLAQADADSSAYSTAHGIHFGVDLPLVEARRKTIESAKTVPFKDMTFKDPVTISASPLPYAATDPIKIGEASTTITIEAGAEIRDVTFDLGRHGHIVAVGAKGRPAVFRHVTFLQDLSASFKADNAVFDDCKFIKNGGWFAAYSSRWTFTSCVLYGCKFGGFTEVDYGFQFHNCAFVSMDLPEIKHPHKEGFSHVTVLHSDWNKMAGCTFIDCGLPPTVCWCAESSNFFGCKFLPGEAFESDKPWQDVAYVSDTVGLSPQGVWSGNAPKTAAVTLTNAPAPFASIPLAGIDAFIPELIIGGETGVSVAKSHVKNPATN